MLKNLTNFFPTWDYTCPSATLYCNKTNILAGFAEWNHEREVILGIFLSFGVKSYLIHTKFWENVRILVISEKSDLATHSALVKATKISVK